MPKKEDVVSEIIEKAAPVPDNSAQDYSDVPVYYEAFSYAKENDEVDLYSTSYRLNSECKQAIVEDYKTVPGWDNPYIQNHVVQPLQGALAVQDVELAYELPDAYFHIQTCEDGFDY